MTAHFPLLPLLLACLLLLAAGAPVLLAPPFPPTAFLGQNYQLRFTASGLFRPSFAFQQLPPSFKGFANGTIAGTPEEVGSFKIVVNYADKTHNGAAEVLISVASNSSDNANLSPHAQLPNSPLYLSFSDSNRVFRAGDAIEIGFQCINAVDPITVSYNNLPDELAADDTAIHGSISAVGLYTFSLIVGDAAGYRVQAFLTLNIQPKDTNSTPQALADVPVRNTAYEVDVMALQAAQAGAANTAKNALQKAVSAKNSLTMAENGLYGTANDLVIAQQASLSYQQAYNDALQNLNSLQTYINNGASAIKAVSIHASLAGTALEQANASLATARSAYDAALASFQANSSAFNKSVSEMAIASQAASEANTRYNQLSAAALSARNAFNASTANLEVMKQNRDTAQAMQDNANQVVPIAQLNVQLASQDNDAAAASFNTALSNVKITQDNIEAMNAYLSQGRAAFEQAKQDLGVSKFNLQQASNRLFVAQAAKEAADKALAIIIAQGNAEIATTSSSSPSSIATAATAFRGCSNHAYPSMFGTAAVTAALPDGVRTSGGHRLAWGDCTKKSAVRVGDLIYYEGSLVESTISLWLLVKVSN